MTITQLRPLPLTESEAAALTLDSYLVQVHNHLCANCGCGERFISLFEVWTHPTKTNESRYIVKKPTNKIVAGLEIAYMELRAIETPICSECVYNAKAGVKYNDSTTIFPALSEKSWAETLARKYAPEPKPASGRPEPTLDQL